MLGLQACSVEQQRTLWNTQLTLQRTEILYRELDFYTNALSTISTASALLAGFAFSGLALSLDDQPPTIVRSTLAIACVVTTSVNLVALCAATFAAIFSTRLALRGLQGEHHVEQAVRSAREEYRLVVRIFVAGVVMFHFALGVAGFLQLGAAPATVSLLIAFVGCVVTLILFGRIDSRFQLRRFISLPPRPVHTPGVSDHPSVAGVGSSRPESVSSRESTGAGDDRADLEKSLLGSGGNHPEQHAGGPGRFMDKWPARSQAGAPGPVGL